MTVALSPTPVLETERLVLRAPKAADWEAWRDFYMSERSHWFRPVKEPTPEAAWRSFASITGHWVLRGWGMFVMTERGSDQGFGALGPWMPESWPEAEIAPPEAEPQAAPSLGDMPAPDQLPPEGEGIDTAQADKPEISNDPATSPDLPAGRALPQAGDAAPIKPRIFSLQDAPSLPGKPMGGFKSAPGVVVDRLTWMAPVPVPPLGVITGVATCWVTLYVALFTGLGV